MAKKKISTKRVSKKEVDWKFVVLLTSMTLVGLIILSLVFKVGA